MKQAYTSKNTSLKQIPAIVKHLEITKDMVILDYGCGKYNLTKEYVESFGATYYGYDPYNRTEEENKIALQSKPTLLICANVLNVIKEEEIIKDIIEHAKSFNCDAIFSVYEGDRTGKGKVTTKGYQRNEKATNYMYLFEPYDSVQRVGNTFYCIPTL